MKNVIKKMAATQSFLPKRPRNTPEMMKKAPQSHLNLARNSQIALIVNIGQAADPSKVVEYSQALVNVYLPRLGVCKDELQIRPTFKEHDATVFWNSTERVLLPSGSIIVEFVIDVVEVDESPVQVGGIYELSTDMA